MKVRCRQCGNRYETDARKYKIFNGCCQLGCWNKLPRDKVFEHVTFEMIVAERQKGIKQPKQESRRNKKHNKKYKDNFYSSPVWLQLRYAVLEKYGKICTLCNKTEGSMHVDHIIPRSKCPQLETNFDNLQVLCADCNLGKSNRSSMDLRPGSEWAKRPKPKPKTVKELINKHDLIDITQVPEVIKQIIPTPPAYIKPKYILRKKSA